jgi:hypothetical protein
LLIADRPPPDEAGQPRSAKPGQWCCAARLSLWDGGRLSADTAELLSPIVRAFEAGKLKFRCSGPRSRNRDPNHWEILET